MQITTRQKKNQYLIILVASLGYFVDIYDLILYNVVKKASFLALGITGPDAAETEIMLFNCQMGGMLAGGILWGIMGDMKGRLKVLFGSILLYSLANIANAYVWDVNSYAVIRFIAGVGLAGELGAGITLITEVMDKEKRGYGTMIVVTFGALGAVAAALLGTVADWKTCYWVGGIMGLLLLVMRVGALESGMYAGMKNHSTRRGDFLSLFTRKKQLLKYLRCIAIGLPVWFFVGIFISLTESYFAGPFGLSPEIKTGQAVMYCYIGLSVGDLLAGLFSQWFRSRKRVVQGYLVCCGLITAVYLSTIQNAGPAYYYFICTMVGISTGYWALFVTIAAEQFGTNIRSTVTTTVPNFVRGAVIPITFGFKELVKVESIGITGSSIIVGTICIGLAILSVSTLKDTFGKDLDYYEE